MHRATNLTYGPQAESNKIEEGAKYIPHSVFLVRVCPEPLTVIVLRFMAFYMAPLGPLSAYIYSQRTVNVQSTYSQRTVNIQSTRSQHERFSLFRVGKRGFPAQGQSINLIYFNIKEKLPFTF